MRAIFIFFVPIILILTSCSSIEVAKEITKVTQKSIGISTKKITNLKDKESEIIDSKNEESKIDNTIIVQEVNIEETILNEKKRIIEEKKKVYEVVLKQKEVTKINLMGKTFKQINSLIGQPDLIREDRQTTTIRYDTESCRIFLFMNKMIKKSRVEYYELRNEEGELIDRQKDIEECFEEIKKT